MTPATYLLGNCFSYHGITCSNLQRTSMSMDVHAKFSAKYTSFSGLQLKDVTTKLNATRIGAVNCNMFYPTGSIEKHKITIDKEKNIPKLVSEFELGRMVNDNLVFRQNICIRSYEIGPEGTTSMETILNLMQETLINHFKTIRVWHDGWCLTPEMCKKNLIWVITKVQVVVNRYPMWGDMVQINTWKTASGKNGMCNNWMFCDFKTGEVLIKASSIMVMMNKETRRLAKFPNEVRVELEQYLRDTPPLVELDKIKLTEQDETTIDHVCNGLTPRWNDLDVHQHVNNVKYLGWILQSVPRTIMKNYELVNVKLEYHRECMMDSVLQSSTFVIGTKNGKTTNNDHVDCEHLLELEAGSGRDAIVKGKTSWRLKHE